MKKITIGLLLAFVASGANAQSLSGISVGNPASATSRLGSNPIARQSSGPFDLIKWRLLDGNELSVTFERRTQKIVYIESDWGGRAAGAYSDYPGFSFGRTTLAAIRKKMGSNGMGFTERPAVAEVEGGMAAFNTYEINGVLVTFITKVKNTDMPLIAKKLAELGDLAKLEAIILCAPEYAATTWGKPVRDPRYRTGTWD